MLELPEILQFEIAGEEEIHEMPPPWDSLLRQLFPDILQSWMKGEESK